MAKFYVDKAEALKDIARKRRVLYNASEELRSDREVAWAAVTAFIDTIQFVSDDLKDDKELVLAALSKPSSWKFLQFVSPRLRNSKKVVMQVIANTKKAQKEEQHLALKYASARLRNDRDVVLAAMELSPLALQFASKKLRDDKDFVLSAIKADYKAFEFASDRLKKDRGVVFYAIGRNANSLEFASPEFKNNREAVLFAISKNADALKFASPELKDDRDIVLAAMKKSPYSIEFASERLRDDPEIFFNGLENTTTYGSFGFLKFASNRLKNDINFVYKVVSILKDFSVITTLNPELLNDRNLALELLDMSKRISFDFSNELIPQYLLNDIDFVKKAIAKKMWFRLASNSLKCNRELVEYAVTIDGDNLRWASAKLRNDAKLTEIALEHGMSLEYASKQFKKDPYMVSKAVSVDGHNLRFVDFNLITINLVKLALESGKMSVYDYRFSVPYDLRNTPEIKELEQEFFGFTL